MCGIIKTIEDFIHDARNSPRKLREHLDSVTINVMHEFDVKIE